MAVKITRMEKFMLECIADSQYQDGGDPVDHQIWIWDAHDNFQSQYSRRSTGGVMASLQKKGLVVISTYEKEDDCVHMTKAGYDAMVASQTFDEGLTVEEDERLAAELEELNFAERHGAMSVIVRTEAVDELDRSTAEIILQSKRTRLAILLADLKAKRGK